MEFTINPENAPMRQSLAETVAWCSNREIVATVNETDDIKHRRKLGRQGAELMNQAYKERNLFWNRVLRRDYAKSFLWMQGEKLLHQADLGSIAPLRDQLRSLSLRPDSALGELRTEQSKEDLVRSVIAKRSELVRVPALPSALSEGRLLLYAPDENLACGAAQYASSGFFDVDNAPPWDIWVAFSQGILVSWVPPVLVALAQEGISVNPEGCIRWMN